MNFTNPFYQISINALQSNSTPATESQNISDILKSECDGIFYVHPDELNRVIQQHDFILVYCYVNWHRTCQLFTPEFIEVVKHFRASEHDLTFATGSFLTVNNTVMPYPSLALFRHGVGCIYQGDLISSDIICWIRKKLSQTITNIETVEAADKFIQSHSVAILGYIEKANSNEMWTFTKVADTLHCYDFGVTRNRDVGNMFNIRPGEILLTKIDDAEWKAIFRDPLTDTNLERFIRIYSFPPIVQYKHDKYRGRLLKASNLHLFLFEKERRFQPRLRKNTARQIIEEFGRQVLVIEVCADQPSHRSIFEFFGLPTSEVPSFRLVRWLQDGYDGITYKPDPANVNADNIRMFLRRYFSGKLQRYYPTQKMQSDWLRRPVKQLTREVFDEIVLDPDKTVLVLFYNSNLIISNRALGIFELLGSRYQNSETVVVAQIDMKFNELNDFKPTVFPTVRLFKRDSNECVEFRQKYSYKNFVKFVDANGRIEAINKENESTK